MYEKQQLLEKIKDLENEMKKLKSCKRYGLVFEEKTEQFEEKAKNALPLLKEEKELEVSIPSPNGRGLGGGLQDKVNLIIEGDNFHSLSCLQFTHKNKIDVIYIDPPYNTGNKDFIYNDSFVDKEDSFRHSKWLSFMKKRLVLAKELLSEKGVIFISIDDNEFSQLKMLCDETFGENNFIGSFIINSTPNARDYGHIGKMHEYCLFYSKFYLKTETNLLEEKEKKFNYKDEKGGFNIHPLYNSNEAFTNLNRPNLYYPFYLNPKKVDNNGFFEIGLEYNDKFIEIFPPKSVKNNIQFVWRWGKIKSLENLNKEIVGYKVNDGEFRVVQKMRNSSKLIRSIISDTSNTSRKGTAEIEEIFQNKIFSFPKPLNLIKNFIKIASSDNSIILDFFAGSGTTGHAVLELNREDGGNRQFILCSNRENTKENPDKNICKNITYERNKRVIEGYTNSKGEKVNGLGGNLKYYKTDFIKIDKSREDLKTKFKNNCNDLLCIKENTFTKVELKKEIPGVYIFKNDSSFTLITYEQIYLQEIRDICKILNKKVNIYIFSLSNYFSEDFIDIKDSVEIKNIPETILETYQKIFNF